MRNHIGGIVVLVLGVVFLLENLGVANIHVAAIIAKWWPVILIVVGIRMLTRPRRESP